MRAGRAPGSPARCVCVQRGALWLWLYVVPCTLCGPPAALDRPLLYFFAFLATSSRAVDGMGVGVSDSETRFTRAQKNGALGECS